MATVAGMLRATSTHSPLPLPYQLVAGLNDLVCMVVIDLLSAPAGGQGLDHA